MNDNLPEINFKEKKEKKRGLLGWLRSKLGLGSRGAIGEAGINPSAMNVGRALGTAKFGASAGLGSFLAGNVATIAAVAVVAVASGLYMVRNAPAPSVGSGAFSSNKSHDNYVPAILRSQAANQGSSLDMFKDTNKGAGLAMEEGPKAAKPEEPKASANDEAGPDANQPAPDQSNMAESMMAKLQGGGMGSLTSSMGGGSNKASGMGGFGNKFNQGATGGKSGFSAGIGTGFQGMPKFDQRKGKMLAMKASSRPVFSGSKAGKKSKFAGSYNQAKGLRSLQKSYTGTNLDTARSTQDKAWEGNTDAGTGSGGAGIGAGGAGLANSPSFGNSGSGGSGGSPGTGIVDDAAIPTASNPKDTSPWKGLPEKAMTLILLSCVMSMIGGAMVKAGYAGSVIFGSGAALVAAGLAICALAAALGAAALAIGIMLMASYGQTLMGGIYTLGGGLAIIGAFMAMAGGGTAGSTVSGMMFQSMTALFSPYIMLAAAAAVALVGGMAGGASGSTDAGRSTPAATSTTETPSRDNNRRGNGREGRRDTTEAPSRDNNTKTGEIVKVKADPAYE